MSTAGQRLAYPEYDAIDQLRQQTIVGLVTIYSYSAYGDLTLSGTSVSTVTSYGYDTASHLIALNGPAGTSDDATFTLDALGRFATRSVAGTLESTYGYLADSETVVALVAGSTRVSAIGPDGSRVATKDGSTTAYLLSDLHGNVAGAEASGGTTIVTAIRYDGYGQTLGTPYTSSGTVALDVRYQGRLDISASGEPLYDMSARFFSPAQGTFTGLDSVIGSAQDPLSMNRFLYAEANPATFIDPTGHAMTRGEGGGYTDIDCSAPVITCGGPSKCVDSPPKGPLTPTGPANPPPTFPKPKPPKPPATTGQPPVGPQGPPSFALPSLVDISRAVSQVLDTRVVGCRGGELLFGIGQVVGGTVVEGALAVSEGISVGSMTVPVAVGMTAAAGDFVAGIALINDACAPAQPLAP